MEARDKMQRISNPAQSMLAQQVHSIDRKTKIRGKSKGTG